VTPIERARIRIDSDLRQIGVAFALIGGLAVSLRAEPRATRDVELAVASDDRSGDLYRRSVRRRLAS